MFKGYQESFVAFCLVNLSVRSNIAFAEWHEAFNALASGSNVLRATEESLDAVRSLIWAAQGLAIAAATLLLVMCAKRLHREDYYGAMLTFSGALIAGASPHLSSVLFLT